MDSPSTNPPGASIISQQLSDAIQAFEELIPYEKELASEPIFIGHLGDNVLAKSLRYLREGKPDAEIIKYLEEAGRSLKKYRRDQYPSSNPIRVYRKDHL